MAENRELALVLKLVADQFQSELKKSQGTLSGFNSFIKDWKTQLTAVSGVLVAVAKSTANYGDELVKTSQRMGTSIEDTARLQHAAKLSDTDLQGLSKTVGFLSKEMLAASSGNADAQRTFDRLGISVVNSNGHLKGTTQILLEMNDKFRLMPEGPEKTALAMLALGKSGKDVLPLLNSDMREAFKEAEQLGLVMSEKDARAAEHFNDELTKLQGAIRGVTNDIGSALIPKFDAISHALRTIIEDARAAGAAIIGLGKSDAPQVGVVKPDGGGRNLRILPAPAGIDKVQVDKFFPTEADEAHAAMLRELERYQQNLQKKEIDIISKRTMEDLHLLFAGANSLRQEVQTEVDRLIQDLKDDNARTIEQINKDFAGDTPEERQQAAGRRIVEKTQREVFAKERDGLIENLKAWQTYGEQISGSTEFILNKRLDLVRAELAKELDTTTDTAGKLLIAWQNSDEDALQSLRLRLGKTDQELETSLVQAQTKYKTAINELSGDFVEGWAAGMRRYVRDTQSGFGLAADMARRAVQSMEQASGRFFFDAMEGRITRLKDVMTAFLDFTKQIVSQLAAQAFTKQIAGAIAGSGFFGVGGGGESAMTKSFAASGTGFATGGQFIVPGAGGRDTTAVGFWATPGETVSVQRPGQSSSGGVSVVVNNYGQNEVQASSGQGPDGRQMIYVTVRDIVRGMVRGGELDGPMGQRFGVNPAPGRR